MKHNFQLFHEKRQKNPIRKLQYKDVMTYAEYVEYAKRKLSGATYKKIRRLKEYGEGDFAEKYKDQKIAERESKLKEEYFRKKFDTSNFVELLNHKKYSILVSKDDPILGNPVILKRASVIMSRAIDQFERNARGLIPTTLRPYIILSDIENKNWMGYYLNNVIWLDWSTVTKGHPMDTLLHEYSHYIADKFSYRMEKELELAYNSVIESYFRKIKKRKNLNLDSDDPEAIRIRQNIAKKMKLPWEYGAKNYHEFFAVLIEYWNEMPNTPETYYLKNKVKKLLNQLR